jgi:hypothetical protein
LDVVIEHLLDGKLPAADRQTLLAYLETPDPTRVKGDKPPPPFSLDRPTLDEKVRGAIHLLLSTPEYQLN